MKHVGLRRAAWFHPEFAARILVAGDAAELWAAAQPTDTDTLARLHGAGCERLIVCGHLPKFSALVRGFPGSVELHDGPADELLWQIRDQIPAQRGVHGTLLQIDNLGVFLRGAAGTGKSALALELLSRGHGLVADDNVDLRPVHQGCVVGSAPEFLRGFLEVRGLGILDVRALYGDRALTLRARVDLVFELGRPHQIGADDRLTGGWRHCTLADVRLPMLALPPESEHRAAAIIEAACRNRWWQLAGHCAATELTARHPGNRRPRDNLTCS